jgi:hypothetical protein
LVSVLSASRVTPWARVLSWHTTATINSSLALGDDGFGPKRLAEPSITSILGTVATIWSTALARDGGSWKKLAERRGPCRRTLVRARLRLPSKYLLGDRSRSQFFVDEGVANGEIDSQRLASNNRLLGNTILVKLKLWELVIVFNKTFWSATNYAYATLRQSVAGNLPFRSIIFCNLGTSKTVISKFVTMANIVTPHLSSYIMVTPTMFPVDKKLWRTQKSLSQKCINSLVSQKLSHDR